MEPIKTKSDFPDGAWCKEGDFVMFRANSGTRFKGQWLEKSIVY